MEKRTCSVEGCDRVARARGWCQKHYYALRDAFCEVRGCGNRRRNKGLCTSHWRKLNDEVRECKECRKAFKGDLRSAFCSLPCKHLWMKSPMRRAVDDADPAAVLAAARTQSVENAAGCWEWQYAKSPRGYPVIGQGGRGGFVHRHVAAAVVGHPVPKNIPVHHKCANPSCINPEHLQLVTHRENIAEMFERNYYMQRIAALEAALMQVHPDHPLLAAANAAGAYTVTTVTETPSAS